MLEPGTHDLNKENMLRSCRKLSFWQAEPDPSGPFIILYECLCWAQMWHRSHPRDRVAVVELQPAIRDASAARAWHSGHFAAWHIPHYRHTRIQYVVPAWSGMCLAADRARLDSMPHRSKRLGYCRKDLPSIPDLFNSADFFHSINTNPNHILQPYLRDKSNLPYQLRNCTHNMTLINKTKLPNDFDFIVRMLYKHSCWFTQPVIQL